MDRQPCMKHHASDIHSISMFNLFLMKLRPLRHEHVSLKHPPLHSLTSIKTRPRDQSMTSDEGQLQVTEIGWRSRNAKFAMNRFRKPFRAPSANYSPDFKNLAGTKLPWKADTPTAGEIRRTTTPSCEQAVNKCM